MSRKNRTNGTVTAAVAVADDSDRHLLAVADDPGQQNAPSTEDKVRAALADNPGSTTAKLAMAAGVGRSTAAKILARWDRDGTAIRTAGDGPRNPDTWTPAPSDNGTTAPNSDDDVRPDAAAAPSTDQPTDHASDTDDDTTAEQTGAAEEIATDVVDSTAVDTTAVQGPGTASEADDNNATTDSTDDPPAPSTDADGTTPQPDTASTDPVDSATETVSSPAETPAVADTTDTAPTDTARTDKDRLRKGGLRALVEEYLTQHPGESFGPAKISKDLVRSGGAVNNALEKLVTDGYAIKTCEAPKRFTINPDKTDVPEAADDTE